MLRVGSVHEEIGLCLMATNRRNWSRWLLVILSVLFAVTYLWRYLERNRGGEMPVDKLVVNHASVTHAQSASLAPAVVYRSTVSADGTAAVPVRFQLAGVGRVRTAPSFQEWLAQFPLYQQAQISAFNDAHFGVYRVNSREQVAWMAANGYPMPEDVVAAERISDMTLLKLADQGNDKAAFLLAERQNKKLVTFLAGGGERRAYYDGMEGRSRLDEQTTIDRLLEQSNSPYKGYNQASEAISGLYADQGRDVIDVRVIAGLVWAEQLGDTRAGQFMTEFVGGDPQRMVLLDTASVVMSDAVVDMAFMQHHGGQRAGAAGRGVPGGASPVY
ncbi:MAG: hypothetical protein ABI268_07060 [Rhodanobacter sp.]